MATVLERKDGVSWWTILVDVDGLGRVSLNLPSLRYQVSLGSAMARADVVRENLEAGHQRCLAVLCRYHDGSWTLGELVCPGREKQIRNSTLLAGVLAANSRAIDDQAEHALRCHLPDCPVSADGAADDVIDLDDPRLNGPADEGPEPRKGA